MIFTEEELTALDEQFTFYQYVDGKGKPLVGQYFAIATSQAPAPLKGDEYMFVAVVKILNQPNSPMRVWQLTSTFINEQALVTGKSPALKVSITHRELINFLLRSAAGIRV
jgi:hypothetical protein